MRITFSLNKTVEQNAAVYFEKAKKAKKKLDGALEAIENSKKKLAKLEKEKVEVKKQEIKVKAKTEWYEKFRWFISSEGFLVIGGRDATTNEIVIKKFTDKDDIVFHTDMSGSPFFVVKCNEQVVSKKIDEKVDDKSVKTREKSAKITLDEESVKAKSKPTKITLQEVSDATASFSRAWKLGMSTLDVFYVKPDQVSKTPQSGEFLPKGAFVIRGKTNYLRPEKMECAIGMKHIAVKGKKGYGKDNDHEVEKDGDDSTVYDIIISGPESAVSKQTKDYIVVQQGRDKTSDVAKLFRKKYGGALDDIIRMLPSGGLSMKKK
ncbi:MAG: NFACT RNA binding domain-containing protein [Candidatus Woesearchaeota archaeon]